MKGVSLVPRPWCRAIRVGVLRRHIARASFTRPRPTFFFSGVESRNFSHRLPPAGFRRKGPSFWRRRAAQPRRDAPSFPPLFFAPANACCWWLLMLDFASTSPWQSPSLQSHRRASQARRTAGPSADGHSARRRRTLARPQPCPASVGAEKARTTRTHELHSAQTPRRSAPPSPTSILARSFEPPPYSHDRAEPRVIGV